MREGRTGHILRSVRVVLAKQSADGSRVSLEEVPDPVADRGQLLILVAAAGVNRADLLQRDGRYPPPPGAPPWLGLEISGVVVEVGESVEGFRPGDQVCALLAGGGYAEKVAVDASCVLPVPAGIDLVTAAGIAETACTVWSNVVMAGRLAKGERFLVHGGSSGIGTMAIQVAKALGATVATTAGTLAKLKFCGQLGADIVINYRDSDFVEAVDPGVDLILDNMGAAYLARNVAALRPGGRLMVIGMQGGVKGELNLGALLAKRASVAATSLRARPLAEKAQIVAQVREHLLPMIDDGRVRIVVDSTYPLDQAGAALEHLESSTHVGKILLTM